MTACEGWRRYGGAFTLGPVQWMQYQNEAVVIIKIKQQDRESSLPACMVCWQEGLDNKHIEIISVTPIKSKTAGDIDI